MKPSLDSLMHIGVKRRSGRYEWGSGQDPRQSSGGHKFLAQVDALRAGGFKDTEIAEKLDMNTTQLRNRIKWANNERREYVREQVGLLAQEGLTNTAMAQKLGVSEGTVRNYLDSEKKVETQQKMQLNEVSDAIKSGVDKTGYLDVGVGVERQLGVSRTKFNAVVNKLAEDEGYHVHELYVKRLSDKTGQKNTTVKVLTKEADLDMVKQNSHKVSTLQTQIDSDGKITNIKPPTHIDLKRIKIRYKEDGGEDKDGLIELRPGKDDLDLGRSRYAQVRIAAGDNLYLKGMVAYSDPKNFPDGVDIIFNTNKPKGMPPEKVLKKMKEDMDNPFGANIVKQKGALNIVNEEGDWDTWSTKMSSQFLSKQPVSLIKDRLDDTYASLRKEFDDINAMTNPVVRKHLMDKYIEGLDSKAKHLKAKGLAGTKSHVLLPFPELKPNEIYAPRYKDGERVVLVRHPHGGIFEIPELVVNNKNNVARKVLGNAPDAVGIHPSVAGKLSGADFDGDTALVIPNGRGQVKTSRSLKELKNFDPQMYKVDYDTISPRTKQREMGVVSNLITDMTIKGASQSELARAVRHSMVVIDSEKHRLDYKKSARDNGISSLIKQYQSHINPDTGKQSRGASTLISRSKRLVDDLKKKGLDITDPSYDPKKYSSGTATEELYVGYVKGIIKTKNEATKISASIPNPEYSKEAAKKYAPEIKSMNAKLNAALLNAPRERQAQLLTNHLYYSKVTPNMDKDDKAKLKSRSLARARDTVNAKKAQIQLTDREWEAVQSRAVSTTKLKQILDNADMDNIRKHASPKVRKLNDSKLSKARTLLNNNYTYAQVAEALGVSVTTIREELT